MTENAKQLRDSIPVEYTILVPLYNVDLSLEPGKLKIFSFQPPQGQSRDIILDTVTISLLRWNPEDILSQKTIERYCSFNNLPQNFAFFDAFPQQTAGVVLVIQTKEIYPATKHQEILLQSSDSIYAEPIVEAFVMALKLFDNKEPHVYKGYYFKNKQATGVVIHWPIKEMQGTRMLLDDATLNSLNNLFFDLLALTSTHPNCTGHRVGQIAQRYYILTSSQTEYDVIFLFLMIAFEALFKRNEEEYVSKARQRFCKLLADKKSEYLKLSDFMSEDPRIKGCCYLRNALVHGNENSSSVNSRIFWELKYYIRVAILRVFTAMKESKIDRVDYYDSLERYIEERFSKLLT